MGSKHTGIEKVYRHHHSLKRGDDFVLLGDERGRFIKENIGINNKILDIGCRDGELTKYYFADNEVWGTDVDAEALKRAQKKLGINIIHMDLNGDWDNIPDGFFDVIVAAEIIEHLYYPDLVLKKIWKALKPQGIIIGSVPHAFNIQNKVRLAFNSKKNTPLEDPTHINHFSLKEFKNLFTSHFADLQVKGIGNFFLSKYFPELFAHSIMFKAVKK